MEQFFALPDRDQDMFLAFPEAFSLMREKHVSASAAAHAAGISRSQLIRGGRSGLKKLKNGRYVAAECFPAILASRKSFVATSTGPSYETTITGRNK